MTVVSWESTVDRVFFFSRAGNFRVFRGFSKNRENILPRKITDAKNYLREKGQSKITLR